MVMLNRLDITTLHRREGSPLQTLWQLRQPALQSRWTPYWLLGSASLLGTLINAPLVLSIGMAIAAHRQLSQVSAQQWQGLAAALQQWGRPARPWLVSGAVGLSTYGLLALWMDTHALWMSVALGSQSLLAVALVLLLRAPTRPAALSADPADELEDQLMTLLDADPLQRLMGVRRVVRQGLHMCEAEYVPGSVSLRSHLIDCLHLMLAQESEPRVQAAIRQGLTLLRQRPQLPEGAPQVRTPLRSGERQRLRQVEYVEP